MLVAKVFNYHTNNATLLFNYIKYYITIEIIFDKLYLKFYIC